MEIFIGPGTPPVGPEEPDSPGEGAGTVEFGANRWVPLGVKSRFVEESSSGFRPWDQQ